MGWKSISAVLLVGCGGGLDWSAEEGCALQVFDATLNGEQVTLEHIDNGWALSGASGSPGEQLVLEARVLASPSCAEAPHLYITDEVWSGDVSTVEGSEGFWRTIPIDEGRLTEPVDVFMRVALGGEGPFQFACVFTHEEDLLEVADPALVLNGTVR